MGGIFDNIIAAMFIHMYLHQWSVVSKKVSSFFDVVIFDRYAKVWQHDCDQHVNFCYLNYLLTQVHNRNFFLYNLSFGFEDEVTKVSLLIFIEVIFSAALTFFFYGLNKVRGISIPWERCATLRSKG